MTDEEVIDETSGPTLAALLADLAPFISKRIDDDDLAGAGRVMATALATGGTWTLIEFASAVHAWAQQQPEGRTVMALPNVQALRHIMSEARLAKAKRKNTGQGPPPRSTARPEFMAEWRKVMAELDGVATPDRDLDAGILSRVPGLRRMSRRKTVLTPKHSQAMKGPAGVHECGPGCPTWDDRETRDRQRREILSKLPTPRRPT